MAVLVKRSSVAGKVPQTTDLNYGEIAVNSFDGRMFMKANNGSGDTIIEVTSVTSLVNKTISGNVTLTATEYSNAMMVFSGTLSSNAVITVPNTPHSFIAVNKTTGNYSLTFQSVGMIPSISITSGIAESMYCDGTGIYATSSAAGGGGGVTAPISTLYTPANGVTNWPIGSYSVGFINVFKNNERMVPVVDFSANDGTSLTVTVPATGRDRYEVLTSVVYSPSAVFAPQSYSTTVASGASVISIGYTPGCLWVFKNNLKLLPADFTATNGTTITLTNPSDSSTDVYEVVTFTPLAMNGMVPTTGGTMTGNLTINTGTTINNLTRNANAGQYRYTSYLTAGVQRWVVGVDATSEPGSGNAGANWFQNRYSDAGAFIDTPFQISRSTGVSTFSIRPVFGAATPWDSANFTPGNYVPVVGSTTITGSLGVTGTMTVAGGGSFGTRPTFNGATPWDSANLTPSSYLLNSTTTTTVGLKFQSGSPPNIASINTSGQQGNVALTIGNASNSAASAVVAFIRDGVYAGYFGLDTDNYWKVGGWSMGNVSYRVLHEGVSSANMSGYLTISGTFSTSYSAYGYLTGGGAGSTGSSSGSVGVSLNCAGRVNSPEFDAFSDRRLKTDIMELEDNHALAFVRYAVPVTYKWKHIEDGANRFGFIAQDMHKIGFGELLKVSQHEGLEETIDDDGWVSPKDHRFSIEYDQVIPIHTSVLKQLLNRVEALEAQVQELRGTK